MKLYSFWRSLAAYRVRIALKLKGQEFDTITTDLLSGDQFSQEFMSLNPQSMVPALVLDSDNILTQSMAILEYLEELFPSPSLLPEEPIERAKVRSLCMIAVADIHPLVVPRVRSYIMKEFGLPEKDLEAWISNWTKIGLNAIEVQLSKYGDGGRYSFGDTVTLADLCIVPQVGAAKMFNIPLEQYPTTTRVFNNCMELPEFFESRPQVQPDFPDDV